MKTKFLLIMAVSLFISFMLYGCGDTYKDVVRIHIRANSNTEIDQSIKLKVRDNIVSYITPLIIDAENLDEVKMILSSNISGIESVADSVLIENGFKYTSHAYLDNEYFPTRAYGEYSFPADFYDALIINLGQGVGDNWWCVAYPPLCFVGEGEGDVVYKSKILEIIEKYFG
ncbi:MAG: stage II sporulation protein R [Clostridia bacterium]|nr:stage II sporulation protein R [Clostridia bacterium]